jgi:hypothetical protein
MEDHWFCYTCDSEIPVTIYQGQPLPDTCPRCGTPFALPEGIDEIEALSELVSPEAEAD